MNHREQLRPLAFDEQRALEELQRLHRDIQRARGDREQAEAEFDTFVQGFGAPEPPEPTSPRPERAPVVVNRESHFHPASPSMPPPQPPAPAVTREARPETPSPPMSRETRSEPGAVPQVVTWADAPSPPVPPLAKVEPPPVLTGQDAPVAEPIPPPTAPEVKSSSAERPWGIQPAVGVAIAAVVLIGLLYALFGGGDASDAVRDVPSGDATAATSPAQTPAAQPAAPGAAPAATPPAGVELEMITRRVVWVRVTVDGRRTIERELPAGERVPLRAEQSIVIRAGDGGAVSVRRGGAETRLGEEGFPITRTFAAGGRGDTPAGR